MAIVRYLTHPQVRIDPSVPIPQWGLNKLGKARVAHLIASNALHGTRRILSSDEVKAIETAEPIADALGLPLEILPNSFENDRSATGFLPPEEFEAAADAFFAYPDTSIRGWETARAAQTRIIHAVTTALNASTKDTLIVGHGGVGTLLWCALQGVPISRDYDQGTAGGNIFVFPSNMRKPLSGWTPMETFPTKIARHGPLP